ncbi:MAG: TIGR03936 family radical SAM-associated protein, partial [Treponema sp.]|nr:TIGR03936 family radical SAM-associated protein [Treponema sp.]
SLSSLSTGDYHHIDDLAESLNRTYAPRHISFQLPSLRVSTFSLPLLEKVAEIRKSGLTFAVETPADAWQLSINKEVSRDQVVSILREAKKYGWRGAKFYFMVGLPVGGGYDGNCEEEEIADFILDTAARTGMHFHVNVGTFIPKPHTPYQWAPQISEDDARKKLNFIRARLKPRGHKVGIQDPFISTLEGIISRGDERVGELIEEAYRHGCRLDAWSEYFKGEIWAALIKKYHPLGESILQAKERGKALPWDCIDSGTVRAFLEGEQEKSQAGEITLPCNENCTHYCGSCDRSAKIVKNNIQHKVISRDHLKEIDTPQALRTVPDTYRIVFSFSKTGKVVFLPHLGVVECFSMAFIRSGIPVFFTGGFNPLPRLDFASPLAMGIAGSGEIASLDTTGPFDADLFIMTLNRCLPQGFFVTGAINLLIPGGIKKHSLASLLWGYEYESPSSGAEPDLVKAGDEKAYRLVQKSLYGLRRRAVLAKDPAGEDQPVSYFRVYRTLYPQK